MTQDQTHLPLAPELMVSEWINAEAPISLADLRGKVIVIEAFQMLCPGCVSYGLPQAQQIFHTFPGEKVAVLGLHTVFEHHDAMTPVSLRAFLHEYRIPFPVGVDDAGSGPTPKTMQAYALRGTPSLLIIDQLGRLRLNHFGQAPDMAVAYHIANLLHEDGQAINMPEHAPVKSGNCDNDKCDVPS